MGEVWQRKCQLAGGKCVQIGAQHHTVCEEGGRIRQRNRGGATEADWAWLRSQLAGQHSGLKTGFRIAQGNDIRILCLRVPHKNLQVEENTCNQMSTDCLPDSGKSSYRIECQQSLIWLVQSSRKRLKILDWDRWLRAVKLKSVREISSHDFAAQHDLPIILKNRR